MKKTGGAFSGTPKGFAKRGCRRAFPDCWNLKSRETRNKTAPRKGKVMQMESEVLRLEHIMQKYQAPNGEITAIQDVSFSVKEGEFVSLVGPSGCGKSTLLSIVAGLIPATSGELTLYRHPVCGNSPEIGYMLQKDNLLDWRSIYKNVTLGLELRGMMTQENIDYVLELLNTYGLYEFKDKYPSQLSGGMRQRAALIRTLAIRPKLLLLDEAFSALDYQTRLAVTDDVYRILKHEHKTALIVTHDIPESISMSDRVVVLSNRPSTVRRIVPITFGLEDRTPLKCREQPEFSRYFNEIWKELDVHV